MEEEGSSEATSHEHLPTGPDPDTIKMFVGQVRGRDGSQ